MDEDIDMHLEIEDNNAEITEIEGQLLELVTKKIKGNKPEGTIGSRSGRPAKK